MTITMAAYRPRMLAVMLSALDPCADDTFNSYDYEAVPCAGESRPDLLSDLVPSVPAEYFELRPVVGSAETSFAQSFGRACATAADPSNCSAQLGGLSVEHGFPLGDCGFGCEEYALVRTYGDDVDVATSRVDVERWIVPIETTAEARLMVSLAGYDMSCTDKARAGIRALVPDRFDALAVRYATTCEPVELDLFQLSVTRSTGGVAVNASTTLLEEDGCPKTAPRMGRE
jgi:hypothetical protein